MRCRVKAALALALGFAALPGCGGAAAARQGPGRVLPSYTGHETDLFDDAIEPRAVGYELQRASTPMGDAHLRERAQIGDAVVRVRVTTVTSKSEDKGLTWQIGLHLIQRLAGTGVVADDFTVELGPRSPSAGIMRAWEGQLIGKSFAVFMREFARPGSPGETELHFHIARDGKEEVAAVRAAITTPMQ